MTKFVSGVESSTVRTNGRVYGHHCGGLVRPSGYAVKSWAFVPSKNNDAMVFEGLHNSCNRIGPEIPMLAN